MKTDFILILTLLVKLIKMISKIQTAQASWHIFVLFYSLSYNVHSFTLHFRLQDPANGYCHFFQQTCLCN